MQRWSKFQFQSKILNKIVFATVFTIIIFFPMNSQVFGQSNEKIEISEYYDYEEFESGFGEVIQTNKIIFEIGKDTTVHVKHVIIGGAWDAGDPKLIKTLPGKHSNLQVTDEEGDYLRPIGFVGDTFEESEYIIAGQKPHKAYDLVAEYDLENFLELEDGLWGKHFTFPHDVEIFIDDDIEIIFANNRPVNVVDAKGINCVGCDIKIEFFDNPEPIIKKVIISETKLEEISSTGEEFILEFLSNGKIGDLNYIKELNYFSFDVNKENQIFLVKIPLDLLLSPYHVYLTENDQEILVESDQILKSEYGQSKTHANLSFRAETEGIIHVVGSTQMEHEKLLAKLQERASKSTNVESTNTNVKQAEVEMENDSVDQFYDDWGNTNDNDEDNTVILIIIGIISAVIIGIIIKLKKN